MPLLGSRGAASLTGFGGLAKLGYLLRNSLRFRASVDAYLSRTPASAGNRQTWTWSAWVKRGVLGSASTLISGGGTTGRLALFFNGSDQLEIDVGGTGSFQTSTAVFRDPAAWYHVVWAFDTTQGTGANRSRIYVNGTELSLTQTRTFTQNTNYAINDASIQTHGTLSNSIGGYNFDGYLTEMNFVNAQQLTPSSFAKTDSATGQWIPKKFGGAYGTNGYYLPFTNTASTTTLGNDFSGNGNNWTLNNISLTAGVTYDSMTDVPTLTSATTANYATLNPINLPTGATTFTYSNGNLSLVTSNGGSSPPTESSSLSTIQFPTTGKFYAEMTVGTTFGSGSNAWPRFGVAGYGMGIGGYVNFGGSSYGTFTTGDIMMVAWDASAGYIWWGKNGTWLNSGVPTSGTGYISTFSYDANSAFVNISLYCNPSNNPSASVNFGQRPFAYSAPSGFKALNTFNLP